MWGTARRFGASGRFRGALALVLVFALAVGGFGLSVTQRVYAAPSAQLGPVESFTGTVVPGTIVSVGNLIQFNLERPALTNPNTLEQLVIETTQGSVVVPYEILSVTGNYDVARKVFVASSLISLGNALPGAQPGAGAGDDSDDNDNSGDDDGDDNDNGDDGGDDENDNADDDDDTDDNDNE